MLTLHLNWFQSFLTSKSNQTDMYTIISTFKIMETFKARGPKKWK